MKNQLRRFGMAAVAITLVGSGVVVANVTSASTRSKTFYACVSSVGGDLYHVNTKAVPQCGAKGSAVTWNQIGPTGTPGSAGTPGTNGLPGSAGTPGTAGTNGTPGTNGLPGTPGTAGTNGTNGTNGLPGSAGTPGTAGTNGTDGTNGLPGTPGTPGTAGTNGTDGTNGLPGTNGTNVVAGQSCPTGQFVTGFDATGNFICAAPLAPLALSSIPIV